MKYSRLKVRQDSFVREMLIVLFVLIITFLPHLHLLASDTLVSIDIFGIRYKHGLLSNQAFFWFLLIDLQIFTFLILLLRHFDSCLGYILLFPIYWIINELFWIVLPLETLRTHKVPLQVISFFVAVCLGYKSIRTNSKKLLTIFNGKVNAIWLGVFFIGLPLIINKLDKMPNTIQEMDFLGFIITSYSFGSVPNFLGVLSIKLLLITTLLLLFSSLRQWWRYSLLVPIVLTTFQIRTLFFPNIDEVIDEYEVFEALPLLLIILGLLVYLSKAAYYQSRIKRLYQLSIVQMEQKKEHLLDSRINQLRQKWQGIASLESQDNHGINELMDLRKELERQLKE